MATADTTPMEVIKRVGNECKLAFGVLPCNAPDLTRDAKHVDEILKNAIKVCGGPYYFQSIHLDYWATQECLDQFVRTPKEFGKEFYASLKK
jgi:hypothetical protein